MKTALITGASAGIGRATALTLARAGYRVYASMRDPAKGESLLAVAEQARLSLTLCQIDVCDDDSVKNGIQRVIDDCGHLDVFINNAGIVVLGAIEDVGMAASQKLFDTNFFGALRCFKQIIPHFRQQRCGHLLVVSSQSGVLAQAGLSTYCASKWALEALTESAAIELAPYGVRTSIIQPGGVLSPLQSTVAPFPSGTPYQKIYDRFMLWNSFDYQEAAQPEDIAAAILAALEDEGGVLRKPTDFAGRNIRWRGQLTDEEWIELHSVDEDEAWKALWRRKGGIELSRMD
jgi:NAD(P)-dependent dehydrogenase (short-subunit alcohol dehydrogenase family)